MENLKKRLLNGELIELHGDDNEILMWFSTTTQRFIIQLNGKVILGLKTFSIFHKNLQITTKKFNICMD